MTEFKIGDKVKLVEEYYRWQENEDLVPVGTVLTIVEYSDDTDRFCSKENMTVEIEGVDKYQECWEIVKDSENNIARPILEERKVGKVPVHMVIDGFPLALKEVAKVMGFARDFKGYQLHDWRQLPNVSEELPAAGYRHMLENSAQKAVGLSAKDRVDDESKLVHLAHELFNKLAELELILSGKIE